MAEPDDRTFVALARKAGYPAEDRLRQCRTIQLDRARGGERASLFATALREGVLTKDQVRRFERWTDQIARHDPAPISEDPPEPAAPVPPTLPAMPARPIPLVTPDRVLYQSAAQFPTITPLCPQCGIDLDDLALMEGRAWQFTPGVLVCVACQPAPTVKRPGFVKKLKTSAVLMVGKVVRRKPGPPPGDSVEAPRGLASVEAPLPQPPAPAPSPRGRIRRGTEGVVKAVTLGASEAIDRVRGRRKKGDPPAAARASRKLVLLIMALTFLVLVVALVIVIQILTSVDPKAPLDPKRPLPAVVSSSVTPGPPKETASADASSAWGEVRLAKADDLPTALEEFAERYRGDLRARDAAWIATRLREARTASSSDTRLAAIRVLLEAEKLEAEHELARAKVVFDLAIALDVAGGPSAERARGHLKALPGLARDEMAIARDRIEETRDRDGAVRALILALDTRERLRGAGVDDQLAALVADLESAATAVRKERPRGPSANVREPIDLTLKLDVDAARAKWSALLAQPLSLDERLRAEWSCTWCLGIDRLLRTLIESVATGKRPEISIRGAIKGSIARADAKNLTIDVNLGSGSGTAALEWSWRQVEPGQALDLLEPLAKQDEMSTLALAFFALATGHEDRGHALLIGGLQRRPETAARTFSFLAVMNESTVPEGGYVVFEARLVAPAERDKVVAARKQAKEDAASAARELSKESGKNKETAKLRRYLARGLALCDDGEYVNGRSILQALATRFSDVPGIGNVARARLDAPYLRRRVLEQNGPSANRLDLYILGEGFLLDDDKQRVFDRLADGMKRLLEKQDFFAEYTSYMNTFAVNLASKEEGVWKDGPGSAYKDTALGGRILDGELTLDGSRVLGLLKKGFPEENDQLAFGIANADAQVATGGSGVAAIPRNFLQAAPHEFGHAFGKLGDEYEQSPKAGAKAEAGERPPGHLAPEVAAPNLVRGSDEAEVRAMVPWLHWLKIGADNWTARPIDVLEGGGTHRFNNWRAQRVCVMRDVGSPYCAVCMEAMVKELYRRVRPIDRTWPTEKGISHSRGSPLTLRVGLLVPRTHRLETTWFIETRVEADASGGGGTVVAAGKGDRKKLKVSARTREGDLDVESVKIDEKSLERSAVITVEVRDPTPWVQKDDEGLLRQVFQWTVEVE